MSGAGIAVLALGSALAIIGLYPRLGAWALRTRVLPVLEKRFDRSISVGAIDVERGRAVLRTVRASGPGDAPGQPLAHIGRVEVDFDFWASLTGDVELHHVVMDEVAVAAVRGAGGSDNFSDLLATLGMSEDERTGESAPAAGAQRSMRPESFMVSRASLSFHDQRAGITVDAGDIEATADRGRPIEITLRDLAIRTAFGPSAQVGSLIITADPGDPVGTAEITVAGGEIAARRGISLSSITGSIHKGEGPGTLAVDLGGSYGGATEQLWTARGWVAPESGEASLAIVADRFTFDRLDSILAGSVVIDYEETAISAEMRLELAGRTVRFAGSFELSGGNVFHPMIAEKPLRELEARGTLRGSFDTATRILTVPEAVLGSRGVDYRVSGFLRMPGGVEPETGERRPHAHVGAHLVIPPVPCQTMLRALPEALVPYLAGFELKGTFQTDLSVDIDWADLQAARLDGSVGLLRCKVIKEPDEETGVRRLEETFTHYVEVEVDTWIDFVIGPENPDFVPIWDVSPHLINSLMTTEDSSFYQHRGFITREFRTALIKNLEAGYFRYGASSITMQTIKNVLLYREKTLARKLQELFLTWYIETILDKDRILEIYVNAIEYGPGLYGIGPASWHYFGKHPRDLNPVEAAFFSSILPGPKQRYKQYCEDKLTRWTESKIQRILKLMHNRERLTDEEYERALLTPLIFDRTEAPPLAECKRMVKQAIANTRPTNPMKK